jgi:hypothetical protein
MDKVNKNPQLKIRNNFRTEEKYQQKNIEVGLLFWFRVKKVDATIISF